MNPPLAGSFRLWLGITLLTALSAGLSASTVAPLPDGVKAIWDLSSAAKETTPTRQRVCLNGLWRWQPATAQEGQPPLEDWGYFKVPGCWPGITDYMQKDCQRVFANPSWKDQRLGRINAAWYQREFTVPGDWAGRSISLRSECLNSYAVVYVDRKRVGEMRFPGGELDVTSFCPPGGSHLLSLHVVAMPLKGVMLSYTDSASAREVKGTVPRRGLCGDVCLVSTPSGPRINDLRIETSVRRQTLTLNCALERLLPDDAYALRARVLAGGRTIREFTGAAFARDKLLDGRVELREKWLPDQLWDIDTPQNTFEIEVSLVGAHDRVLDTWWTTRFGFRELWIDGKDFVLNGSRIFLCAVPLDNAQVSAASATYSAALESLKRLKSFGINFVYTHNYDCLPGSHLAFEEVLRAADDAGMLVSFSQPHFSHYDWRGLNADQENGYSRNAEYYVRLAQNHPSVVMYSMSHNATGYSEDMNPDLIDGIHAPRDSWSQNNARLALRAEAIVRKLDPSRIVYHHASGNLGSMHVINFYPNFVPIQELSDWFGHWSTNGVKPVFMCEYGAPFTWDWTMYRGWYNGQREFGSAAVPWEFCLGEWNSQFLGDIAFKSSEAEKQNLRWEAQQFRAGKLWHRWDYPNEVGSTRFEERYPVFAMYLTDNWRAFRAWGVSAISPWEYGHFWRLREGVQRGRKEFPVDWEHLQRPGFSPDYLDQQYERMDLAFGPSDWVATPAAQALLRNNAALLGYVGGRPGQFTSKDHNFLPGETVQKQLIVINNSRRTVACSCDWSCRLPEPETGHTNFSLPTGQQLRVRLSFDLPPSLSPGRYEIEAVFDFGNASTQKDSFFIDVLPKPPTPRLAQQVALFDPKGETRALLDSLGVRYENIAPNADLRPHHMLIVGKGALDAGSAAPDIGSVRQGLKVVVFEQTSDALEKRLGFRVEEYGLRRVFPRVADHPVLQGLGVEHLRDWRGEATLLPARLEYETRPRYGPTVDWCGIPVTRLWRCGNRGNVASVLIEKPARGDFLPILDGGFDLQYSPLLEYREGAGMVLFCQMDVTGRTEKSPAAQTLTVNIINYAAAWRPSALRRALYAGDPEGGRYLNESGIPTLPADAGRLDPGHVLIVGPGGGRELSGQKATIRRWLDSGGGKLLAIGLGQSDLDALLPFGVRTKEAEHISAFFETFPPDSPLAGVGPSEVHNRDPRKLPLIEGGAEIVGDGVLAVGGQSNVVFCQIAPWAFHGSADNLRRTYRRLSFLVSRLAGNLGAERTTPLLERFSKPAGGFLAEKRWANGLYADQPEEWDDPYRHFRW